MACGRSCAWQAEGALGTLDLSQCRAVRPVPTKDTAKAFYFEVDAPDRTYLINTDSTENRDEWIQAIQEGLERMQLKREGGELRDVRNSCGPAARGKLVK